MTITVNEDIFAKLFTQAENISDIAYFDIKYMKRTNQTLTVKNDVLEENNMTINQGLGIRVLVNGAWGFSASNIFDDGQDLRKIVLKAYKTALTSSRTVKKPVSLVYEPTYDTNWKTQFEIDPFAVSLEEKVNLLVDSTKNANINDTRIKVRNAFFSSWKDHMLLWTSEGTKIDQEILVTGGGTSSVAIEYGETYTRSLPASFRGDFVTAGYEFIKEIDLISTAKKASKEAVELLGAKKCPSTKTSIILKPSQLMLQIHESCGHPTELDRALDYEAAFAGTSFLKPYFLEEEFYYGNENVSLVANANTPRGLGTFGFDHEGVKAQRQLLVDKGLFVGFMSSRETASQIGLERSSGAMRSDVWNHIPLIRMTNVSLEPGDWDFDELVGDTREGIIMDTNKSWSIDDLRLNFQFSTEIGWQIEDGEITNIIKSPSYYGITPKFWGSCSGVTKEKYWKIMGTPNCGKGEPGQIMYTGHGSSPARFENVTVGIVQL